MNAEKLYPNIVYFELAKELPLSKVGSIVNICDADGRECLFIIDGLTMPIDTAIKEPSWFKAIDVKEHQKNCYENSITFFMSKGKSKEEAEAIWNLMGGL